MVGKGVACPPFPRPPRDPRLAASRLVATIPDSLKNTRKRAGRAASEICVYLSRGGHCPTWGGGGVPFFHNTNPAARFGRGFRASRSRGEIAPRFDILRVYEGWRFRLLCFRLEYDFRGGRWVGHCHGRRERKAAAIRARATLHPPPFAFARGVLSVFSCPRVGVDLSSLSPRERLNAKPADMAAFRFSFACSMQYRQAQASQPVPAFCSERRAAASAMRRQLARLRATRAKPPATRGQAQGWQRRHQDLANQQPYSTANHRHDSSNTTVLSLACDYCRFVLS